jgi:pimeloyl-ACP methyl ester carboxylesterase
MATASSPASTPDLDAYGPQGRSAWLDVDWPAHQRWVEVAGRPVNVIELGAGEQAAIFIHGLSGSWQNWLENLPVVAQTHRVIALDLPGFGASPMPAEQITISGYARIVDELLATLGVERACIVGNSMGGFVGAELAIAFPERAERLVLVAAAGLSIEYMRNERQLEALRRVESMVTMYGGWIASKSDTLVRRVRTRRSLLSIVCRHPELLPAPLAAEQLRGSGKPGFLDALDALTSYPIRHRLGEIACPTLIVHGDRDRLVPIKDAHEFERLIPGAKKLVYADTGHVPMLERPARFNADLEAFLRDEAPRPA